MAIHLTTLRPAVVRLPPVPSRSTVHVAVTSQKPTSSTATDDADAAADFRALFGGSAAAASTAKSSATTAASSAAAPAPASPDPNAAPTVESVFGSNPWVANPTGVCPDGTLYSYNPIYFATPATAQTVAQMVGGTVVQNDQFTSTIGDPFHQSQSNNMVQLANGALVNPGLIASFYTHGYPQWMVDQMVSNEVAGATNTGT